MEVASIASPKTILFLIDGLSGGGAERVVVTLAGAMAAQGDEVILVSLRKEKVYEIPAGVKYLVIEDNYRGLGWRLTELRRRAMTLDRVLKKYFSGRSFDLAISHLPKTDRIVAKSSFLKESWMCLHCALTAGELQHKKGFQRWRKQRQLVATYSSKKLITVSRSLQEDVRSMGIVPSKMVAIYNPFDLEKIRKLAQEKNLWEGERFLVHVGRFHAQKRHDRLLEAFKISGYDGKLLLVGEGSEAEKQKILQHAEALGISNQLVFVGFVANPYSIMRAAEALVLSSDYEGLANVLVEALACGTAVVSTDCPYGPREILQGALGQGLSELSSEALAAAIQRVLSHPVSIREEMLAPFTVEESVRQYQALMMKSHGGLSF